MAVGSTPGTTDSGGESRPRVLMLGTAEWDAPIATNQHYVARELAKDADVTFVESLGLRRPTLRRADIVRMAARVRKAAGNGSKMIASRPKPEHTEVVSPLVLPVHRAATSGLNRALLHRATQRWLKGPRPRVLWTFTPVTYDLEAAADVVIYHCVDLLRSFPGIDAVAVDRGEHRLAPHTTVAIATSTAVQSHLAAMGFSRIDTLPNVADVEVFRAASRPAAQRLPRVLFSGNLTIHKLDVDLLEAVARALQGRGELLLAGPLAAGGGSFDAQLQRLQALGARYLGVLTHEQLADVAGTCSVGLIPYALNAYTRGVSPLKCFEYLSSGLAVLSTRLPAVEQLAGSSRHVTAAEPADLPAAMMSLLAPVADEIIAARAASAAEHGWEGRGRLLREMMATELARRVSG